MRELPRQLSAEQLAELFEGRTRFVERLAEVEDPLGRAREISAQLSDDEKKEVLDAHPAIGASKLSASSAAEQGDEEAPPELEELNRAYEEKFGFRFVVFVNRRPRREIVPILRERLGRTRFVERLAALDDPLGHAREVALELSEDEKKEILDAHPAIGGKPSSARSAREQGTDDDPAVLAELAELNAAYEAKFGFRFVVFVNGRPRREIVPILRARLERTRDEELSTAVDELVQIAVNRWRTS